MRWRKTQGFDLTEDGRDASGRVNVRGDELPLVSSPPHLSSPTQASSSPSSSSSLSSTPLTSLPSSSLHEDTPASSTSTPGREVPGATSVCSLHDVPQASSSTPRKEVPWARSAAVPGTRARKVQSFTSFSSPAKSPSRTELEASSTGSSPARRVSAAPVLDSVEGSSVEAATTTVRVASAPQSSATSPHHPGAGGSHSSSTSPHKMHVSTHQMLVGMHMPVTPQKTVPISPQKVPISPQKIPVSPQKPAPVIPQISVPITPYKSAPVSPQKIVPVSPQKNVPVSSQKSVAVSPQKSVPVSPQKSVPISQQKLPISLQNLRNIEQTLVTHLQREPVTSPQRAAPCLQRPETSPHRPAVSPSTTPSRYWRPASETSAEEATPPVPDRRSGGVLVVVNGGFPGDSSPRHLQEGNIRSPSHPKVITTIPIGDVPSHIEQESREEQKQADRKTTNAAPRKSSSKPTANGEAKKTTHEKNKSVTIVVNDQQVTYSNTPHTYTTNTDLQQHQANGITNGDLNHLPPASGEGVVVNGHAVAKSDADTRPSSAASLPTRGDPDIQVRPLVGWWTEPSYSGASVVEDTASSDECHRSTLTLVHSPARTYLSGEAGDTVGGEDSGEAWSSVVSGVCGVVLIIGAASILRLPRLLYEYGAGSFLAAWCAVLFVIAAPIAYLEACLSQFSSSAALAVWRLIPIARGVGWSTVVVCFYWAVVVLGYVAPIIHYILLWINPALLQMVSPVCSNTISNYTNAGDWALDYHRSCVYELPDEWQSGVKLTFAWPLPATMAAAAVAISLIATCGARTLAGITGFTAILAVIGLSLQLGIGLTEMYRRDIASLWELAHPFLIPQGNTLLQPRVWCAALAHVLLSLGLGVGLLMNFSSRGSFRFTLRRHLWGLLVLVVVMTALVTMVSVLQLTLLASDRGLSVHQALSSLRYKYNNATVAGDNFVEIIDERAVGVSVGAAVITASHLMAVVTFPFVWLKQAVSTIIFIGLWCSGVTTGTVCVHTLIAALRDARDCLPRATAALILAPLLLTAATPSVTKGGAAVVALLDGDVLTPVVLWPPFTLTLAITAIYGIHKVRKDFTFMLEATVSLLWIPVWGVFIPLSLLGVVVWACVMDGQAVAVTDGPGWRTALVWALRALVLLPVPITAIYVVKSQLAYGIIDKVASSLQSSREWGDWGPQDPIEHHNWRRWREDETRPIASLKRRFANRPLTYTHSTLSSESSSTLTRLRNKYQRNGTASIL
ncbi:sodium- and chloride-dependent glycine transporter 2 isoform X3 [Cherax quadricarinatus]|uniref:sodium- and chloride-dependent glycine transporter 2 isoform X3 n=1 Tax=Cherax quadricarinatus TaxID=27406 RepID=UPI00387E8D7E